MQFECSQRLCRTGTLSFKHKRIATPALVLPTFRGLLRNLTIDQFEDLPVEALQLSLEHFLDAGTPSFQHCPSSLHEYFGYKTPADGGPLLFMTLKDLHSLKEGTASYDAEVAIHTSKGRAKVAVESYTSMALKKPPDLLIAASDEPDVENPSRKRLHNSVVRSIDWASKCAASLKASPQVPLIVALSGSNSTQARVSFGAQLAQRNDDGSSLDDAVSGYLLRHAPLRALPLENVSSLFKASLDALPAGKLRIASTDAGPHTILHLIRHVGIDLFIDSWAFRMAEIGIALDFDFPPPPSSPSEAALGVNLFDSMHARDFSQLSQSSLAVQSVEKQPALRGYIHHLLWTHEISAHVILALHNVRVIVALLERASRLLASSPDAFDAAADAFAAAYSDDSQLVEQASAHLAQVKDNRGKGRDKRRAAEEAAATLAEAGSSQLVLDGAAQG